MERRLTPERIHLLRGQRWVRPERTVPAEIVEVVEVQPVMVRVRHEDGQITAIPKREFGGLWLPVES